MTTDTISPKDYDDSNDFGYEDTELDYEDAELVVDRGMNFADGFQFGCGFWAAGLIAFVLAILAIMLLSFLLSFVGVNLLG